MPDWRDPVHWLSVNALRFLAVDAVERARSGHPGLPLGAAPAAYVLWTRHLKFDPARPEWPDRDRFVLSAGHGSALLYALLHLSGYDVSIADLERFRQWASPTPGHPERALTPGVEVTTGPLGQGIGNAVGLAIAERSLAARFNGLVHDLVGHRTYALVSDGDLMEGISSEAASLAGHLRLGRLVVVYDSNGVSLDGPTSLTFTEDVGARFRSFGWEVLDVPDGDRDLEGIDRALSEAEADDSRPSLVTVHTTLGYGSPHRAGTRLAHGSPLGAEEAALTKEALSWPADASFLVPREAREVFAEAAGRGRAARERWETSFAEWAASHVEKAREWEFAWGDRLPEGWDAELPTYEPGKAVATREAGGEALNAVARRVGSLLGGDADLSSSTKTRIAGSNDFEGRTGTGRNIRFGVREHAMGAVVNGIACHGGVRPFAATFMVFSDHMRPAVRLAAIGGLPVVFIWTHDSVALGEDGTTHQPVEHLASLRAMPGLTVIRPCDANEAVQAWRVAMERRGGPVALVLTRQKLPVLDRNEAAPAEGLRRGAYVLRDAYAGRPEAIVIATGSEVHVALEAREELTREGVRVRVVSMPSWELFREQPPEYRDSVLPPGVPARVAVEAGSSFGWERWVGDRGRVVALDRFGASAPGEVCMERFGFTPGNVARAVREVLKATRRAHAA
ncbi:MAG: transketolase [Planctomycetota bacterium]|jgi:transketolase